MIQTSDNWKEYCKYNDTFHIKATMYDRFSRGTSLTDKDFMMGSVKFTDAMSGLYEIEFGAVVTNSFSATLNNFDGKFDDWKWKTIAIQFSTGTDDDGEWIYRGSYYIDRPKTTGNTIQIECYDIMDKLNKNFAGLNASLTYPIQSNDLITSICTYCGLNYVTNQLSNFTVNEFEVDETTSCKQVLKWILETLGAYARMDVWYQYRPIHFQKWNIGAWGESDILNGGTFSWTTGGSFDGGVFDVWDEAATLNGGLFYEGQQPYTLDKVMRMSIALDDVEITGIKAFSNDGSANYLYGNDGYIVTIRDNPLVDENNVSEVATRAWGNVQGLKVRPFEATIIADPSMEAGDVVTIEDSRGNYHRSIITSLEYTLNGGSRVGCYALTPEENFNENQ